MENKSATRGIKINEEIAAYFYDKALVYEKDENKKYRAIAFRRAAKAIENLDKGVDEIYKRSWLAGLQKIDGIGNRLARAIELELKKRGIRK